MTISFILLQEPMGGGGLGGFPLLILIVVVIYIFVIRPQMRKKNKLKNYGNALQEDDKVLTVQSDINSSEQGQTLFFNHGQVKGCPYCGEEILAIAKKCKHCGEWLNDNASVATYQEYYYLVDNEKSGPLGVNQLKSVGLKPNTLVWTEGLDDWKPVKEVEELKILLKMPPPPSTPPISSTPKRGSEEEEYENTIALYLENGYEIVNQSADSTILLSSNFRKGARMEAFAGSLNSGTGGAIQRQSLHNTQIAKYQVTIRITKTGGLQITSYTLDKHKRGGLGRKIFWGIVIAFILFL